MVGGHDSASGILAGSSVASADPVAPTAADDPLSDVLRNVRLNGALFFLIDATWPWGLEVPPAAAFAPIILPQAQQVISYHVVLEGSGVASVPGAEPTRFSTGDVVVFPHGDAYAMLCRPGEPSELTPDETMTFFRDMAAGRLPFVVPEGGGGAPRARFACGFLGCDARPFNPLLESLPRMLRIERPSGPADDLLDRLVEMTLDEARSRRPGGQCLRLGLSELMFVEALRRHVATRSDDGGTGWPAALRDPGVGRALAALHAQPAEGWTLEALAREAGVSRSVLAERFAALIGCPPMAYLARWRMQLAARRLSEGAAGVADVAAKAGYASEAAFSRAFKKIAGVSPAAWRAGSRAD